LLHDLGSALELFLQVAEEHVAVGHRDVVPIDAPALVGQFAGVEATGHQPRLSGRS